MKIYQQYAGSVVMGTYFTREKAQYMVDWSAAIFEDIVRSTTYPDYNRTHMNRVSRACEEYYVMEVEVCE